MKIEPLNTPDPEAQHCCRPLATPRDTTHCPWSGSAGKPVKPLTLHALLKPELREQVRDEVYRFCGDPTCELVYYSQDGKQTFTKSDLTVRVGVKEQAAPRPLCYCFGHSVETLRQEWESTGGITAIEAIKAEVKAGTCRCDVTNPSGGCCLGEVIKAAKDIQSESPKRRTTWAAVGLGLLASACCWLPLALAGVGVAGGAAGARVAWLRPWALGGLGVLFGVVVVRWATQRLRVGKTKADCCEPLPRFPFLPVGVLVLSSIGAFAAPRYLDGNAGTPAQPALAAVPGGTLLVLSTPQFDCASCVGTLPQTLEATPGVASVRMDFNKLETRIAFKPGADVDATLVKWNRETGFTGREIQRSR